jgi:hypothetical protein
MGRALLAKLAPHQRSIAMTSDVAPDDILTRNDPVADLDRIPRGLSCADMPAPAKDLLERLVRRYFDRAPGWHGETCWRDALDAGLDKVMFAWAGSDQRGRGHYYCVIGGDAAAALGAGAIHPPNRRRQGGGAGATP